MPFCVSLALRCRSGMAVDENASSFITCPFTGLPEGRLDMSAISTNKSSLWRAMVSALEEFSHAWGDRGGSEESSASVRSCTQSISEYRKVLLMEQSHESLRRVGKVRTMMDGGAAIGCIFGQYPSQRSRQEYHFRLLHEYIDISDTFEPEICSEGIGEWYRGSSRISDRLEATARRGSGGRGQQ